MPPHPGKASTIQTASGPLLLRRTLQVPRPARRSFSHSSTAQKREGPYRPRPRTVMARKMYEWLRGPGAVFKQPTPGSTNYLGAYDQKGRLIRMFRRGGAAGEDDDDAKASRDGNEEGKKKALPPETVEDLRPFPLNPYFHSEAVLSEDLRTEIYRRVVELGQTVREVSIDLKVDMRRIGAVVRLKTIEQNWLREGKQPLYGYQKTVLSMLPQTPYSSDRKTVPQHESINDLPVHSATRQQLFWPTSESRPFTRTDAGHVFREHLLPADARIPHPEMIATQIDRINGAGARKQEQLQRERLAEMDRVEKQRKLDEKEKKARHVTVVKGRRWDFQFEDYNVQWAGRSGRGRGIGGDAPPAWRYGMPFEDRKKGQVRIPTRVE